jgi:hypothetical protein
MEAVQDASLDGPLLDVNVGAADTSPRWLWCLVGDGGVSGQQVFVRFFADEAPHDLPCWPAKAPTSGSKAIIVRGQSGVTLPRLPENADLAPLLATAKQVAGARVELLRQLAAALASNDSPRALSLARLLVGQGP